ncbi:hypothetical protein EUTSA_v10020330mg [Eutrema salsugineum]|uniref:J domain-containing protein n=2 Tax=Eutrema salsugineum TaxID=72664 RepID=V4NRW9_EUTSA|nr:hypothetical protein EUTSA_v10020330mg [Eutrema salsugineum]
MNINRDEALRAKDMAEDLMKKTDFTNARKLALRAHKLEPSLENISRMIMVCDVHCAATEKLFGNEMDWYGILQVELNANDITIKKQYKRLALLLHPDKNKLPGAESAFKLIGEAQRILLDKDKRAQHDIQRKTCRKPATASYKPQQVPNYHTQQASDIMRNVFNFQSAKSSCHTTSSFPQQNKFPGQKACNETEKRPGNHATVSSRNAPGSTAENNNGKRKRNNMVASSESSDSESDSESDDVVNDDTMGAQDLGSNGGEQRRRSVRSKRQVSYDENLSDDDDDVDLVNENGKGSGKNIDAEREEEKEDEKQTHEDHHSTETLPNGKNPKEKIKEDQVESSGGDSDPEEELSSGSAAKPNIIQCVDADFNDFDKEREKSRFQVGQIWALYEEEGMPRFYALIKKVKTPDFLLKYVWLEADEDEEDETRSLPVSVGNFELGEEEETNACAIFSHLVYEKTRRNGRRFKVFPRKGETWALYKNWNKNSSSEPDSPREYEFVEILSDSAEQTAISVASLSKVKGFTCVFRPMPKDGSDAFEIPPHEFRRFSHRVPSVKLKGTEGRGVSEGWYELDPAALPFPYSQNISGEETTQDQDHQSPPSGSAC